MTTSPRTRPATHRIVRLTIVDHLGHHDGGEVKVHVSRFCSNCARDGTRDAEWVSEGCLEELGRCMSSCPIADADDLQESDRYCDDHQTQAESDAFVHRPHRPVFGVLEGGAA
jgi:hypothetical protein